MIKHGGMNKILSFLGLLLLAAFLSLFTGFAGMLIKRALQRSTPAAFMVPLIWVGKDLVLERILSGFPWCLTGYSQYQNLYFIQWAEFGGIHLISAVVVFFNLLIYLFIRDKSKKVLVVIMVSLVSIYSSGYFLYKWEEQRSGDIESHQAGIIQPNYFNELVYGREKQERLNWLFSASRELKEKRAEFVVWPEYTVPLLPLQTPYQLKQLMDFVAANVPIIAGFNDYIGQDEFYNTAFLFKKQGIDRYYKVHLTPFGEYVPFRKLLFFVKNITSEIGDYSFGQDVRSLELNGHAIAAPICYEMIFPELVRDFAARGAELIVTISNDSWVGDTSSPRQIFSMAIFRTIENRRCMLRATSTGISAAVASSGKIIYQSRWNTQDTFIAPFKYIKRKTLFTRFGYLFPHACFFFVLVYFTALPLIKKVMTKIKARH